MNQLKGTGVALVTPFNEDHSIDFAGLKRLIDFVILG
jgi:4-hydroxy-tetrahydrodipicolinate synthase